jgi:hypothetical protein
MDEKTISRFWRKVDRDGPEVRPGLGCCWLWTGPRYDRRRGHGGFYAHGRKYRAHRASFLLHYGDPGPYCVCHTCDNGEIGCVNPEHLFLGTQADNVADMIAKQRGQSPLTDDDVRRIHSLRGIKTGRALAAEYGVAVMTISNIMLGKSFRHLGLPPHPRGRGRRPHGSDLTSRSSKSSD